MFVTVILKVTYQNHRDVAQLGGFLGHPGRIQTGFDQTIADNTDIRIIPISAEIDLGSRIHPAYLGLRSAGSKQQHDSAEN
jgi:hypothetical protein